MHLAFFLSKKENIKHLKPNNSSGLISIKNLLYSGLWLGISPYNFIALNLVQIPFNEWKNFIFIEEANSWHTHLNRNDCSDDKFKRDLNTLTDKKKFSEYLLKLNIPAIETIGNYDRGSKLSANDIHSLCSIHDGVFIKPNSLNAMRGCFQVNIKGIEKNKNNRSIAIWGRNLHGEFINKRTTIESMEVIQKTQQSTNIIIQPLLKNNDYLTKHILDAKWESLITFRIISKFDLQSLSTKILSASIEYPKEKKPLRSWGIEIIDIESGLTQDNITIPSWLEIKSYVNLAHKDFKSIKTIAWDVCLHKEKVKIIEGNFGWGVIEQQKTTFKGILSSI